MNDSDTETTLYFCSEGSGWSVQASTRDEAAAVFARRLARQHGPGAFPYVLRADFHGMDGTSTRYEATHVVPAEPDGYSPVGRSWFTVKGGLTCRFPRLSGPRPARHGLAVGNTVQNRQQEGSTMKVETVGVRNGATEYRVCKVHRTLSEVAPLIGDHGFTFWQSGIGTYAEVPTADGDDEVIIVEEHADHGDEARLWGRGCKGLPLFKLADRVAIELENVLKLRAGQNA